MAFVTPVVEHWLEREIAQWVHHEGSIRRPIAPYTNALTTELHLAPLFTLYIDIKKKKKVLHSITCLSDLNEQLSMLQDQYLDLKTYTDRLVNEVMLHCPQLLEAGRFQF